MPHRQDRSGMRVGRASTLRMPHLPSWGETRTDNAHHTDNTLPSTSTHSQVGKEFSPKRSPTQQHRFRRAREREGERVALLVSGDISAKISHAALLAHAMHMVQMHTPTLFEIKNCCVASSVILISGCFAFSKLDAACPVLVIHSAFILPGELVR